MDDNRDLQDIAYDLYQALDRLLAESQLTSRSFKRPAEGAMKAYEEWEERREQEMRAANQRKRE